MSNDMMADIGFSYEAVLEAVEDSSRGRWFLDEFKKRTSQVDSAKLMDAVGRIELRVEGMSGHFTAAEDLAKVRQAIAKTRSDIVSLQPETKGLSEEGKLFAHLADLARKSMPEQSAQTGIEQALRLVDQIDSSINSNVTAFPALVAKPAEKYFQQDAAVFEQKAASQAPGPKLVVAVEPAPTPVATSAPAPANVERPIVAKPAAERVATGAKLSITRIGQPKAEVTAEAIPADVDPEVKIEPTAVQPEIDIQLKAEIFPEKPKPVSTIPVVTAPAPEKPLAATAEPAKPRIVIIRRKPEEIVDMPMPATSSAA